MLWHEFSNIVRFPMNDNPAVFPIIMLRDLFAVKLLPFGLLLRFVVHYYTPNSVIPKHKRKLLCVATYEKERKTVQLMRRNKAERLLQIPMVRKMRITNDELE